MKARAKLAQELVADSIVMSAAAKFTEQIIEEIHVQKIRPMQAKIDHLSAQLRNAGIRPMSEFICACGVRKSAPVENEPKF